MGYCVIYDGVYRFSDLERDKGTEYAKKVWADKYGDSEYDPEVILYFGCPSSNKHEDCTEEYNMDRMGFSF